MIAKSWISLFKQDAFKHLNFNQEEESLVLTLQMTSWVGIAIVFGIAAIYMVCASSIPKYELNIWFLFSVIVTVVQSLGCIYFVNKIKKEKVVYKDKVMDRILIFVFLDVIALSSFSIFFYEYLDSFQMSFVTLMIIVISIGSALTTFGIRRLCYPYIIPIYTITGVNYGFQYFLVKGGVYSFLFLMIAFPVFLIVILLFAEYIAHLAKSSYDIRFREKEANRKLEASNIKLEEALQVSERANKSKVQFLASASHDLRQPVHALSLFSAALRMQPLDGLAKETAKNIDAATQTLSNQLDALFDISKLDTDAISVDLKIHDVRPLFDRLHDEFSCQAQAKKLSFDMNLPDQIILNTDTLLFERVLKNILSNSIKYTNNGGIKLVVQEKNSIYEIEIIDTGLGIEKEAQHYIFDEFYQVDNDERDREKGLGLGLAIVKRLCEKLAVPINVVSEKGQGSVFTLTIPQADASMCEKTLQREAQIIKKDTQVFQVLLVDDDPIALKGTQAIMQALGHHVIVADRQALAMKIVQEQNIDVMLVDYRLKGEENGLHVIEQAGKIKSDMLMAIISGDVDSEELLLAKRSGLKVLNKPVNAQDIQVFINGDVEVVLS